MIVFIKSHFNNREIAAIIYVTILFIVLLSKEDTRTSLLELIKIATRSNSITIFLFYTAYLSIITYTLQQINIFNQIYFKDLLYWYFGTGTILFVNSTTETKKRRYFLNTITGNITIIAITQFLLGIYTFNLAIELISIPILIILISLNVIYKDKEEYSVLNKITNTILGVILLGYFIFFTSQLFIDFKTFFSIGTFSSFLFPVFLTIFFIPFIYISNLILVYETIFHQLNYALKNQKELKTYTKKRLLTHINFNLKKAQKLTKGFIFGGCKTKADVNDRLKTELSKGKTTLKNSWVCKTTYNDIIELGAEFSSLSINDISRNLDFHPDQIYTVHCPNSKKINCIIVKVLTKKPIFAIINKEFSKINLKDIETEILKINWDIEYSYLTIESILEDGITNQSFDFPFLYSTINLKRIENDIFIAPDLGLKLHFAKNILIDFESIEGYNIEALDLRQKNKIAFNKIKKEATKFQNTNSDKIQEINLQCKSLYNLPTDYINNCKKEFKTKLGNFNYYNIYICFNSKASDISISDFLIVNKERNKQIAENIFIVGNRKYCFTKNGLLDYTKKQ